MNRAFLLIATFSFALPLAARTQSTAQSADLSTSMSGQKLQSLTKSAHTNAQYKQLATYYHQEETIYRAKAADEKAERDRRAQINAALYQKYPRPVDSSEYRYEAFSVDADHAAAQAQHYDQLVAADQTGQNGQIPSYAPGKL